MPDHGARFTDEQIAQLEARLTAMYETAYTDVRKKYIAFVKRFLAKDKEYRHNGHELFIYRCNTLYATDKYDACKNCNYNTNI
mgnify:CR=1 FL=1